MLSLRESGTRCRRGREQHVRAVSVPLGSNSPVDCWKVRGSLRRLISRKGGCAPGMVHQKAPCWKAGRFSYVCAYGRLVPGAPSGTRTARARRSLRRAQDRARVPTWPDWLKRGLYDLPSGRAHASRKRSHSPRGEVAKNVPPERFLNAPADGAPYNANLNVLLFEGAFGIIYLL